MIDIHSHILPGIDDGATDWEQAVRMARQAVDDGIEGVVCTPHWVCGVFDNSRSVVLQAIATFREKLAEQNIALAIYPGAELKVDGGLLDGLETVEILTLNDTGRYALIELPAEGVPHKIENLSSNYNPWT